MNYNDFLARMRRQYPICVHCGKEYREEETDIQLCENCKSLYDLDRLWKDHDENKICAIDFNDYSEFRKQYLKEK